MVARDVRWLQRFQNFERALDLLHEPFARGLDTLSMLEKEGTIQRFEVALELAWKTVKDYLEAEGQIFDPVAPRTVLKEAFAARVVRDGQVWIDMLDHRNLLSHTYDETTFDSALAAVRDRYLQSLDDLREWLGRKRTA